MLYGFQGLSLDVLKNDGKWGEIGRSCLELHVFKGEVEKIQRCFPVLYSGSDISKIARAEEKSYVDELNNFKRIFVDDKGKALYVLK